MSKNKTTQQSRADFSANGLTLMEFCPTGVQPNSLNTITTDTLLMDWATYTQITYHKSVLPSGLPNYTPLVRALKVNEPL